MWHRHTYVHGDIEIEIESVKITSMQQESTKNYVENNALLATGEVILLDN